MKDFVSDIVIEWDDEKEIINRKKHGISFRAAKYVFADLHRMEYYDAGSSTFEEDRYITLGMVDDVLLVVYTQRKNTLRIISARLAGKRERRIYYDNY